MPAVRTRQRAAAPNQSLHRGCDANGAGHPVDPLEERVDAYFARYGCPGRGGRILVALSGGADSVALLAVLQRQRSVRGWEIGAAHVNYGLRGAESEEDHRFCRRLARLWGVRFHSLRPRSPRQKADTNLQLWAREVRYRFFARVAAAHQYDYIAVGHTVDDRAENIAAAVIDAAGTFALSGIPPVRGNLIRPLFDCTRRDVEAYLQRRDIPSRRDSSNGLPRYRRNRIRTQVLPQWEVMNPSVVAGLARMGEQLWLQRRFLEDLAQNVLGRAVRNRRDGHLTLDAAALRDYDACLDPFVLRAMIEEVGLSLVPRPSTVTRFRALRRLSNGAARTIEQGDMVIARSKGTIAVTPRAARGRSPRSPIPVPRSGLSAAGVSGVRIRTEVVRIFRRRTSDDTREAYLDLGRLQGPLSLRAPRTGDRYRPIGLGGSKKLSDLLSERGVPAFEREEIPLLVDRGGILWPVGCPIAERAHVTERTLRILRVRVVRK